LDFGIVEREMFDTRYLMLDTGYVRNDSVKNKFIEGQNYLK
jgi:hypothetical protein